MTQLLGNAPVSVLNFSPCVNNTSKSVIIAGKHPFQLFIIRNHFFFDQFSFHTELYFLIFFAMTTLTKGRHQKINCRFGGEGVRKIIEFSSFTNDEKHGTQL